MSLPPKKPLISVIVPTHNSAKTISIAIESMLSQTYPNLEIIVVDDNSIDNTEEIVKNISKIDSRLKYFSLPFDDLQRFDKRGRNINAGYMARNYGLEKVHGEWITFQDADDASLLNRIEVQFDLAQKYSANHVCVNWQKYEDYLIGKFLDVNAIEKDGLIKVIGPNELTTLARKTRGKIIPLLGKLNSIIPFEWKRLRVINKLFFGALNPYPGTANSPLFKREIIKKVRFRKLSDRIWPSFMGRGADRDFNFQVALTFQNSVSCNIPLYLYRANNQHKDYVGYNKYIISTPNAYIPHASKPTMAFIDHSFHKKTLSGDFLRELLSVHFEVADIWNNSWSGGEEIDIDEINKFDYVFYFQVISPLKILAKLKTKIIWAPMYDGEKFNDLYWKNLANLPIKIICFSNKLYEHCKKYRVDAISVQYYFNPALDKVNIPTNGNHFFFWYRGDVSFKEIKKIINPENVSSFIYKSTPDPSKKREEISVKDIEEYQIKIIETDFVPKKDYLELLSKCNFYIAPRKKEGIGMSFLEAMALGHTVIAYDDATMNEYIKDNFNGYLFAESCKFIDFKNIEQVRKNSIISAKKGYTKWENDKKYIINYIFSEYGKNRKQQLSNYYNYILYSLIVSKNKIHKKIICLYKNI